MESITVVGGEEFSVNIDKSSNSTLIGSFDNEEVDIDDINKFGDGEFVSEAATLGHELVEQKAKQLDGDGREVAHAKGLEAESLINGVERGGFLRSSTALQNFGLPGLPVNGNIDFPVSKEIPGKILPIKRKVSIKIKDSNVTDVTVSSLEEDN